MTAPLKVSPEPPKPVSVLWLSLASNLADHGHEELITLAAQHACTIGFIDQQPPVTDAQFAALVQAADAFIVSAEDVVCHAPFRNAVVAAVQGGKRLLVLGPNLVLNTLLIEFDLAITEDRLCDLATFTDDERTLFVRSPRDMGHPVAHALLEDVPLTTISSPSRVWYSSGALPLLVAGEGTRLLNTGDFFEATGPRVLCSAGYWPVVPKATEGVLVVAGSCFRNPCVGPTGKFFPGIRANITLAEKVIEWLRGDLKPTARVGLVMERLHAIEVGLYDIVVTVLKRHFTASPLAWWYDGIPEGMRKKAAELNEDSKGRIPKEQGFFFISYRQIIEENWALFSPYFETEKQGKKSVRWIQSLNDLRNRLSHPLRIREEPVTPAETAELGSRHEWISNLCHRLQISKE